MSAWRIRRKLTFLIIRNLCVVEQGSWHLKVETKWFSSQVLLLVKYFERFNPRAEIKKNESVNFYKIFCYRYKSIIGESRGSISAYFEAE